jgi:2-dehydro-3-deoxyphosphogluconate aldolase/(4S)-4-hydroxy-2-oxoglutarate aldolase
MEQERVYQTIEKEKIMAIIRKNSPEELLKTCDILQSEGLKVMEFSLTSPSALTAVEQAKKLFPHILLGAGTVLSEEDATRAILAGADFLVSPSLNEEVVKTGAKHGVPVIAGVFTPTEVMQGIEWGCKILKVFPANVLTPKVMSAFQAPFPSIQILPMGGVDESNAIDWLKAGALCLGIGAAICNGTEEEVRLSVRKYKRIVKEFLSKKEMKKMNYKLMQQKFDKEKWNDSILLGEDTCGNYPFCPYCNKEEEYPCAKAKARAKGVRVRIAQLKPRKN